jgi:hypothetical protein
MAIIELHSSWHFFREQINFYTLNNGENLSVLHESWSTAINAFHTNFNLINILAFCVSIVLDFPLQYLHTVRLKCQEMAGELISLLLSNINDNRNRNSWCFWARILVCSVEDVKHRICVLFMLQFVNFSANVQRRTVRIRTEARVIASTSVTLSTWTSMTVPNLWPEAAFSKSKHSVSSDENYALFRHFYWYHKYKFVNLHMLSNIIKGKM